MGISNLKNVAESRFARRGISATRGTSRTMVSGKQRAPIMLVAILLAVLAGRTRDIWPMALACALGGVLLACWIGPFLAPVPTAAVGIPDIVTAGAPAAVALTLTNDGRSRTRTVVVTFSYCGQQIAPVRWLIGPLEPDEHVRSSAVRTPARRGFVDHAHVQIESLGAFGLFRRRFTQRVPTSLTVLPMEVPTADLPAFLAGTPDGGSAVTIGEEIRGIREWRAGDSPRQVHWRSTARTGSLTVVERDERTDITLVVLAVGTAGEPAFEHALAVAASYARRALQNGAIVRLVVRRNPGGPLALFQLEESTAPQAFARLAPLEPLSEAEIEALSVSVSQGGGVLLAAEPRAGGWQATLAEALDHNGAKLITMSP